jgi:hypothetical protein
LPAAACTPAAGGGQAKAAAPTMKLALMNGGDEGWLGSPAVADLDGDGANEVVAARGSSVVVWKADGALRGATKLTGSRIWSAPVVGNFIGDAKLEIAAASRGALALLTSDPTPAMAPGFPVTWRDEMRSIAAGDVDADGKLEIVVGTTSDLDANNQTDILHVFRADGKPQPGFPPNTTGTSGCDTACYTHAGFDQNVAVGPIDALGGDDIFLPQDNAYISVHQGSGVAFDASTVFRNRKKILGVRFMLDYAEAKQGYGDDAALQAHFTNSPGTIADIDGDGENELIMVSSVQNVGQDEREKGVALFVIHRDGTRPAAWEEPFHVPAYLAGLWDLGGNIVALTNQVAAADIDPATPGLELVFAGFDGKIHAVSAARAERWSYTYTTDATVLTGGVAVADLSGDGAPEIVFASYSTGTGKSALVVLDAGGNQQHKVALPGRGAMAVPTIADVDGDGAPEIVVSLKDGGAGGSVLVYGVAGAAANCLPWPTGRANLLRSGYVRR